MAATHGQFPSEVTAEGEFHRQEDAFRDVVSDAPGALYPPTPGRYHLYVSLACPWAHRTLIVRHLRGLESAIGVTVVDPVRDERGWAFRDGDGFSSDPVNGFQFLREAYLATKPDFRGRWTVPVLWDTVTRRIVNNSEDDLCRMFNDAFAPGPGPVTDLFPANIATEQAALSGFIHDRINNGVYRAGFATRQRAYERAARSLFEALDELDARLATRRFLLTSHPVETDWRLFCTLIRFDAVYHGHFKCNVRQIREYRYLDGYLRDLYQQPGIAATVNLAHIRAHYYVTHTEINPTQIVPIGPALDFSRPHGRESLP